MSHRWLVVMALLAPASLVAQTKFVSRVDSVRLDVLVTVGAAPIAGLTADDFEVRDNGVLQKVQLLDVGTVPLDVTIALDMSSSLQADRLQALRRGSGLLLNGLKPDDRAGLLTFSETVFQGQALTEDTALVRAALKHAALGGGTALADAMYTGITLTDAAGRRPLLIVFSDGIDTISWLTAADVITAARRFETVVYGVSTAAARQTPKMLRDVTSQTGGQLLHVTARDLEATFERILEEFRSRYLLSYTLPAQPAPGFHQLDVRVKRRGAQVRARAGYLVGPSSQRRR